MLKSIINRLDNGQPLDAIKGPTKANGAGFGSLSFKPFKVPLVLSKRLSSTKDGKDGARKRKRVNYKEDGQIDNDGKDGTVDPKEEARAKARLKFGMNNDKEDLDEDGQPKKKRKVADDPYAALPSRKTFDVYEFKPAESTLKKGFAIPEMRNNQGQVVETRLTLGALGVCRRIQPIPRPLHDPFADHAIVLYDPTIDEPVLPLDETQRLKLEAEKDALANRGPHKSLASILGLHKSKEKEVVKVPVVIDPRLAKVLRPHQVEGVKFLYKATTGKIADNAFGCALFFPLSLLL